MFYLAGCVRPVCFRPCCLRTPYRRVVSTWTNSTTPLDVTRCCCGQQPKQLRRCGALADSSFFPQHSLPAPGRSHQQSVRVCCAVLCRACRCGVTCAPSPAQLAGWQHWRTNYQCWRGQWWAQVSKTAAAAAAAGHCQQPARGPARHLLACWPCCQIQPARDQPPINYWEVFLPYLKGVEFCATDMPRLHHSCIRLGVISCTVCSPELARGRPRSQRPVTVPGTARTCQPARRPEWWPSTQPVTGPTGHGPPGRSVAVSAAVSNAAVLSVH